MESGRKSEWNELLRRVSRSFYLTLRALPQSVGEPIGLAYLLARATDSIADTELLPPEERLAALEQTRRRIAGETAEPLDMAPYVTFQGRPAETRLLLRLEEAVARLEALPPEDRDDVRRVLNIIVSGQALDLERFGAAQPESPRSLQTEAELDDYTYRVAGCVGEFWSRLCRRKLFPRAPMDEARWLFQAKRFGQGLQLVNILRDLPEDLRQGRCYLPGEALAAAGARPERLAEPEQWAKARPLFLKLADRAAAFLAEGWSYTLTVPRSQRRIRLACAWPILIGARTLTKVRAAAQGDFPRARAPVKVRRGEVRRILAESILRYPFPESWNRLLARWMAKP